MKQMATQLDCKAPNSNFISYRSARCGPRVSTDCCYIATDYPTPSPKETQKPKTK